MCKHNNNLTRTSTDHQILLKISDVAVRCGVSEKVISRWIEEDGLPVHRLPGRGGRHLSLIHRHDLDTWLAQFRVETHGDGDFDPMIKINGRRFFDKKDSPKIRKRRA